MKNQLLRNLAPYLTALIVFLILSFGYFYPLLEGKQWRPGDLNHFSGMIKEKAEFEEKTGQPVLWTNSMFSGMPTYLIGAPKPPKILSKTNRIMNLFGVERPINYVFLYLLGFYITLIIFRVNPWLSLAGAIAFAFSTYFFDILNAGHASKAATIGYMPPIIAGVCLAFRRKIILGSAITGLFLALQLLNSHLQITYYTMMVIIVLAIYEFVRTIQEKQIKRFILAGCTLLLAAFLAVGSNLTVLWTTYEYGKYSIRGKPELTSGDDQTEGLDKSYVTGWSLGIGETFTFLVPNFVGGSTVGELSENSETYKLFERAQGPGYAKQVIQSVPLYWGKQPFTGAPFYLGAVVLFFFILGLFVMNGKLKWWLVTITVLSILLSWGRNFMFFTELFLNYFPGYNKFRTVTMILVIAEFAVPLLAFLGLQEIISGKVDKATFMKGLKYSLITLGGLTIIFIVFAGTFKLSGPRDEAYISQGATAFIDALIIDRKHLLQKDSVRSLVFILLAAALIYFYFTKKLKKEYFIGLLGLMILIDMWSVDKRYMNNDDLVPERQARAIEQPIEADLVIQQDPEIHYRVYDVSADPFQNTRASNFHKSIGGYHGAKMQRYQDIISFHIARNNMNVLNMLNTRWFIVPGQEGQPPRAQFNRSALGNAWFVDTFSFVNNADEEIAILGEINPADEAIVDVRFSEYLDEFTPVYDSTASIILTTYQPDNLVYEYHAESDQLAVFSEVYYDKGWEAYIDNEPYPHFRANYILRAMVLPPGQHTIEFKFRPKSYYTGKKIAGISSIILLLLVLFGFGNEIRNYITINGKKESADTTDPDIK